MNNSNRSMPSSPPPPTLKRNQQSRPATDRFGLPLKANGAKSVTSSPDAVSAMRSLGACPAPPSLMSSKSMSSAFLSPPGLLSASPFRAAFAKPQLKTSSPKPTVFVNTAQSFWEIPEGSVKEVPAFYPIERTSTLVIESNPSEIASRISGCLRRRSIAASYGKVKAKAKCVTMDGVEFRIRLYAAKNEYKGGVIVEVQRRSGWSTSFNQDCNAVLESAKADRIGEGNANEMLTTPITSLGMNIPARDNVGLPIVELLRCDLLDVQVAGMEGLCSLTDVVKMGADAAVTNVNEVMKNVTVRNLLARFIKMERHVEFIQEYHNRLRDLSIRLLSNCTGVISQHGSLKEAISQDPWLENELIPLLLDELKQANNRPNEATYATKCLKNIVEASLIACNMVVQCGGYTDLSSANKYGQMAHDSLAYETKQVIIVMGSK